jgi:hypothetical protein
MKWSMAKLHSRDNLSRIAALIGLTLYVDLVECQEDLIILIQQLEQILPIDSIIV